MRGRSRLRGLCVRVVMVCIMVVAVVVVVV